MGTINHYGDIKYMTEYMLLEADFLSSVPLFDCEKITFPLSTSGMKIIDSTGRRIKLAGGNWSGGHMKRHCVGGLDEKHINELCDDIKHKFDMNCVRLTFSLQMFYDNNVVDKKYLLANPELIGKSAMEIFDITIEKLTKIGLMVILNNHTSRSQWCCSDFDGDGLWYSEEYPEEKYFICLKEMAKRYRNNLRVVGMDLRNEIRRGNGVKPTWGDGNEKTDWRMAAEKIGNELQTIAPHWLIIVGGIQYQLDLTGVREHPVRLKVKNKLVYSGHFYGFSWPLAMWSVRSEEYFKEKLFNEQIYVRGLGVPYFLGEFGNNCQDIPWSYLLHYLRESDIDWTYWCLDGYKCDEVEDETFGVWDRHFQGVRHPDLLADMKKAGRPVRGLNVRSRKQ